MTALAGFNCAISAGGSPLTITGEACTSAGAGSGGYANPYFISDPDRRAIDPQTAVTVYDGASPAPSTAYTLDYAQGVIDFASPPVGVVTITGKYVPLLSVAEARAVEFEQPQGQFADVTRMGDAAPRALRVATKCSLKLDHFTAPTTDLDPSGSTLLMSTLLGQDRVYVEAFVGTPGQAHSQRLGGWFSPASSWKHALGEALQGTVALSAVVQTCVGRPVTEQAVPSLLKDLGDFGW